MGTLNSIIVGFCGWIGFYVAAALLLEFSGGEWKSLDFWKSIGKKSGMLCGLAAIAWLSMTYLPAPDSLGFSDDCSPSRSNPC